MLDQADLTYRTGQRFLPVVHLRIEWGGGKGQDMLVLILGQPLCYVHVTMVWFKLKEVQARQLLV